MGLLLKWGNWAVAKLVEALFNTSHLSDVGCTYKLLHRSLVQRLLPELVPRGQALEGGVDSCEQDRRLLVSFLPRQP